MLDDLRHFATPRDGIFWVDVAWLLARVFIVIAGIFGIVMFMFSLERF